MGLNLPNKPTLLQEQDKFNKPNTIIKVAHSKDLSAKSKKILNIFIRELLKQNQEEAKLNYTIQTSISKITKQLNIKNRNDFYKNLNELYDYSLDLITMPKTKTKFLTRTRVIGTLTTPMDLIEVEGLNDKLIIEFTPFFVNKLIEFSDTYSKLDLIEMSKIKGSYTLTLYENFMRIIGTYNYKKVKLTEEELRILLHLKDKYKTFKSFNQLVIQKSIRELNDKTSLTIVATKIKKENINYYEFEINQDSRVNFRRFKEAIINMFNMFNFSFKYKKVEYVISRDLDSDNSKNIIVNADTYKVLTTTKATEIYEYLFNLYKKDYKFFIYTFFVEHNLNLQYEEIKNTHKDYELIFELYTKFYEVYEDTKMKKIEL